MRRFRRVHDIKDMTRRLPLRLYLFDALQVEGRTLIDLPYTKRWESLSKVVPKDSLAPRLLSTDPGQVESFLREALKAGHEGLMAKSLSSDYSPGARGKKWFKLKPADTLDVVIVAADRGSGRRVGWLSNYHLAVRDDSTGEFLVIGSINNMRFLAPVVPGDRMEIELRVLKFIEDLALVEATATVDHRVVATGKLGFARRSWQPTSTKDSNALKNVTSSREAT